MILKGITNKQIMEYLKDEVMQEQFVSELYSLAAYFRNLYPVYGVDEDDYLQDLVIYLLSKVDKYDENRASFSYFAMMWLKGFRNNYINTLNRKKSRIETISLDNEIIDRPSEEISTYVNEINSPYKDPLKSLILEDALERCDEVLRLYVKGYTKVDISKILGISRVTIDRRLEDEIIRLKNYYGIEIIDDFEYYDYGI